MLGASHGTPGEYVASPSHELRRGRKPERRMNATTPTLPQPALSLDPTTTTTTTAALATGGGSLLLNRSSSNIGIKIIRASKTGLDSTVHDGDFLAASTRGGDEEEDDDDEDTEPKYLQLCLPLVVAPTISTIDAPAAAADASFRSESPPLGSPDGEGHGGGGGNGSTAAVLRDGGGVFQRFRAGIQTPTTGRKPLLGNFRRKKGEEE